MTLRALLATMLRRWYVPVAVIVLAAVLMIVLVRDGGTYTTRTVVSFTHPSQTLLSYGSGANDINVIAFAGAVASEINNGRPIERYSDDSAPLYGAGVRQGVLVGLTATGNQWATNYPRADIEIQIVGRSREWVQQRQQELITEVLATVDAQQRGLSATSTERISVVVVPLTRYIGHVAAGRTELLAAAAAMLGAAVLTGGALAVLLDQTILNRPVRRMRHRSADVRLKERTL
jgi:hypothetical protein